MKKVMNESQYVEFASQLLNDIESSVRLMYITNHKPSTKGAVVVMVAEDTDSNTIHYISEGTELYNSLKDSNKAKIQDVSEDKILVMIVWKGMFTYYQIHVEAPINFTKEQIADTEENEEKILTLFYYDYMNVKSHKIDMTDVGDEDTYNEACKHALKNTIEAGKESPEALMTFVYYFIYKELKKIDYVDGKDIIKPENMLPNLSDTEKFNFSFIGGTILAEIFDILGSSDLKENEKIDYRLDIENFITVANSVETLEFDKNTKSFDHLVGMANEIRESAKNKK
jgi:hypothetical protein